EVPDERAPVGNQLVVLAAERHDRDPGVGARAARDAIGLEPGAVDERAAEGLAADRLEEDTVGEQTAAVDACAGQDLAARPADDARHGARHLPEIDDPGLRDPEPRNPRRVRLPLPDALRPEPLQPL